MVEGPICEDQVFAYKPNGTHYIVICGTHDETGNTVSTQMKMPDGTWKQCVVYRNPEYSSSVFVRDLDGFREKFRRIL